MASNPSLQVRLRPVIIAYLDELDRIGGFGEGRWSRDGVRWVIKHTGVQQDGTTASATNILSNERPGMIRWVATDRVVGNERDPDAEANVLVRVPPPRVIRTHK